MANDTAPVPVPSTSTQPKEPAGTTPVGGIAPVPKTPIRIKGVEFRSEDDAFAEIERGRQSGKLLTEAQKRLHESTRRDKVWDDIKSEVKTKKDAKRVIEQLGLTKEEAVEVFGRWIFEHEIAPKEMSPEQRRIKELEAEKAQFLEARKKDEDALKSKEFETATRREEAKLRDDLTKLLTEKKFPSTRIALRRLANYMQSYADAGADIPADRAADMVMEDYRQEFTDIIGESSAEQLAEFFGPGQWQKLAQKVSEWALSRARGKIPAVPSNPIQRKPADKEEKINPQQFMKYIGSIR